jgi:crotonobetainyl-CoA:carnitine CoA-transferase CaiB-like acyl-CoA transferase
MSILEGIKVVELGLWVAGPAAAGILADWGADVIKVEPPRGDPMRNLYKALSGSNLDRCPPFELYNRGKRSVSLDLGTEDGAALLHRMLADADVLITNMRSQFLTRIGLDHEQAVARYPRLVYASLTGYGLNGPDKDAPGFDVAAFSARSGVAERATPPGQSPPILPGGMGDNVTALALVSGILGALLARERTGRGQLVSTSLLRTGLFSIAMDVSARLSLGRNSAPASRQTAPNPLMNPYQAGDGKWFWLIGAEAERHWPGILRALGAESLGEDARFSTARDRRRNAAVLVDLFDEILARKSREDWAAIFKVHDVWWAPVNGMDDIQNDAQIRAAGAFVEMAGPSGATQESLATPVDFGEQPVTAPLGRAPALGEHTTEVLKELGLADAELADLRAAGAIT